MNIDIQQSNSYLKNKNNPRKHEWLLAILEQQFPYSPDVHDSHSDIWWMYEYKTLKILCVSKSFLEISRCPKEKIVNLNLTDMFHPEDLPIIDKYLSVLQGTDISPTYFHRIKIYSPSSKERTNTAVAFPQSKQNQNIAHYIKIRSRNFLFRHNYIHKKKYFESLNVILENSVITDKNIVGKLQGEPDDIVLTIGRIVNEKDEKDFATGKHIPTDKGSISANNLPSVIWVHEEKKLKELEIASKEEIQSQKLKELCQRTDELEKKISFYNSLLNFLNTPICCIDENMHIFYGNSEFHKLFLPSMEISPKHSRDISLLIPDKQRKSVLDTLKKILSGENLQSTIFINTSYRNSKNEVIEIHAKRISEYEQKPYICLSLYPLRLFSFFRSQKKFYISVLRALNSIHLHWKAKISLHHFLTHTCKTLVKIAHFENAWILITDKNAKITDYAVAGIDVKFFPVFKFENGKKLPKLFSSLLDRPGEIINLNTETNDTYMDIGFSNTVSGEIYYLIGVGVPTNIFLEHEELFSLIREIGNYISSLLSEN